MKKIIALALLLALLLTACSCAAQERAGETVIVTSFYPIYVFVQNVAQGIPGVRVQNMADQSVGCLHDYQLQTRDMVLLEDAAVLVINGGGMEQFMDRIAQVFPQLPIIDSTAGIELLCDDGHDAHDDHDGHDDHDHAVNAHVWLDPKLAIRQVETIAEGLAAADPVHAEAYRANAQAYTARLAALDAELSAKLAPFAGRKIITFHEAFTYFARAYGLEVAGVIAYEPGEEPGTREIAATCDLVRQLGITTLFIEPQYPARAAETIARETGAAISTLDPIVSGDGAPDSYERVMRETARVLEEALTR